MPAAKVGYVQEMRRSCAFLANGSAFLTSQIRSKTKGGNRNDASYA